MLGFFKVFFRGILCTILLPFILLIWLLYGVFCLISFAVMLVKSIIIFFMGDSLSQDMKEDIEAKRILLEKEKEQDNNQQMINVMYQNAFSQMQNNMVQQQVYNQQNQQITTQQSFNNQPTPNNTFSQYQQTQVSNNQSGETEQEESMEVNNNDQSY